MAADRFSINKSWEHIQVNKIYIKKINENNIITNNIL